MEFDKAYNNTNAFFTQPKHNILILVFLIHELIVV